MDTEPEYYGATMISSPSFRGRSFNKKLDPSQLDISDEDQSFPAKVTRIITSLVSRVMTPRQVIVLLRLLKALTFCTLCLTVISDLWFVFYVEIALSNDVNVKLGGFRDRLIRIYGIGLAVFAVLVELDMKVISDHFAGLKPFLVRSMMLLFVATVSSVSPMIGYERKQAKQQNNNYNSYGDDGGDDDGGYNNYNQNQTNYIKDEVPGSTVAFQAITSFIL